MFAVLLSVSRGHDFDGGGVFFLSEALMWLVSYRLPQVRDPCLEADAVCQVEGAGGAGGSMLG